jgi:hypothetical protein
MKKIYILTLLGIMFCSLAKSQTFFDNFDSYTAGDYITKANSRWTTWSGTSGGSDDNKVSNTDAFSGKNSLAYSGGPGPSDIVLPFGGEYNKGMFVYKQMMKISASSSAYFNFQADSKVGTRWALEVTFGTGGTVTFTNTTMTVNYPQGTWFEFKVQINFALNRWEIFINGVSKGYFSNSINQVASVDLYSSASTGSFWIDNVYFKYYPPGPNDGGIVSVDSPVTYCSGSTRNVYATVRNYGNKALDSITLNWSVNRVKQTSVKYKTKIDTANSSAGPLAKVKLGSYTFKSAADTIKVWTLLPNGVTDTIPMNDTFAMAKKPSPPPIADAGNDQAVCPGTKVRIGTTGGSGNTYSWTSKPAGYTASTFNADVTPSATTTYYLKVTSSGTGCFTIDSVTITVKTAPKANAGSDKTMCAGDSVQIGAAVDTNLTYVWTSTPAGFTSKLANPIVKPSQNTSYSLSVTNKDGCTNSDTMIVNVNPLPTANAGSDQNICKGSSAQIGKAAVSGNTYSWRSVPAGFTSSVANPTVTPSDTTVYILKVTNSTGCVKEDEVKISVSPLPVAEAGNPSSVCAGSSVKIGSPAKTGQTYSWTSRPAGFTSFSAEPTVSPTVTTTYKLLVRGNGCTSEDSVTITIVDPPKVDAGTAQSVCSGDSVLIGTTAINGVTYSWTSSPAGFSSTSAIVKVSPSVTTTYTLVGTNTNGCTAQSKVTVTVKASPVANAGSPKTICSGESAPIGSASQSGYTYSWTSDPAGFTSTNANPTVSPTTTTTYKLVVTNASGCSARGQVIITISNPTASFHSSNAGMTTTFTAKGKGYKTYEWDFGDAAKDTGYTVSHTYSQAAQVKVHLKVTTQEGCTAAKDSFVNVGVSGIRSDESQTYQVALYPNPFTSVTTMSYTLPRHAQVEIVLLDVTGRQVAQLVNAGQAEGLHEVRISSADYNLQKGIYFVQMHVEGSAVVRKIIKVE